MNCSFVEKLFSLEGKTAIVTGASRGIGAAIANAYVQAGATVVGIGRSLQPSDHLLSSVIYTPLDIANTDSFQGLCEEVYGYHQHLDILVNAAAITCASSINNVALIENFDRTIDINLKATFRCCVHASQYMQKGKGGSIINVTSIAAIQGFPGNPGYVASKGAVSQMSKALAIDFAQADIRVNNLVPGYIHTAMTEQSYSNPLLNAARRARTMLNRWGEASDLVGAAIFLGSDASGYITGSELVVDGGWTGKGL